VLLLDYLNCLLVAELHRKLLSLTYSTTLLPTKKWPRRRQLRQGTWSLCRTRAAATSTPCSSFAASALTVTVVVTEEWHALLASAGVVPTLPERVRFATILNVLPSEHGRGADPVGFIEAVHAKMGDPVGRLLDQLMLERKPEAIVVDTYLTWGGGGRRGARDIGVLALDHAGHILPGALPHGPVVVGGWQ
jgi:hypothetical protein